LALRTNQAGESTFPEFLAASWRAGVVRYDVDFAERTVARYGNDGEDYRSLSQRRGGCVIAQALHPLSPRAAGSILVVGHLCQAAINSGNGLEGNRSRRRSRGTPAGAPE
jgi:hypothetical protein